MDRRYLSKQGGQWRAVRLLELATLLSALHQASNDPDVGFEDAQRTLDQITRFLNKKVYLPPDLIECGLWACNLLSERDRFRDAKGRSFEQFLKELLPNANFDRFYNTVEWKGNENVQLPQGLEEDGKQD